MTLRDRTMSELWAWFPGVGAIDDLNITLLLYIACTYCLHVYIYQHACIGSTQSHTAAILFLCFLKLTKPNSAGISPLSLAVNLTKSRLRFVICPWGVSSRISFCLSAISAPIGYYTYTYNLWGSVCPFWR